jgi:hypothetical protein
MNIRTDWQAGTGILHLRDADFHAAAAELFDSKGKPLGKQEQDTEKKEAWFHFPGVQAWSPESPVLYTLRLSSIHEGKAVEPFELRTGFRNIRKEKNRVFLNDTPLKLWGLNYREPLPEEGRNCENELRLFKQAGINYLRSLYYPYSKTTLDLCDEMGIIVEQCAPFYETGQTAPSLQNIPGEKQNFISEFSAMFQDSLIHPSVLIWCLGGNSSWGANFRAGLALARETDPARLVNFHYPMTIPEEEDAPDIWSVTHIDWRLEMDRHYDQFTIFHTQGADNEIGYAVGEDSWNTKPVLHINFAMPPCYNRDEIERDYGIREFWGEGLGRFKEKMLKADGCLGGAIMAAVDEDGTFLRRLKGHNWGILDKRGNPKPEYHHVRMAFRGHELLENEKLTAAPEYNPAPSLDGGPYTVSQETEVLRVQNRCCRFVFSRATGLLLEAAISGVTVLSDGPFLQTTRLSLGGWRGRIEDAAPVPAGARVVITGEYTGVVSLRFILDIDTKSLLSVTVEILSLHKPMPHSVKAGVGVDPGGLAELGIAFTAAPGAESLYWKRRTLLPWYPEGHPGRSEGIALRVNINDFCSMKHHIKTAELRYPSCGIAVPEQGELSVRVEEQDDPLLVLDDRDGRLKYDGLWREMDDYCGNYLGTESLSDEKGAAMEYHFEGTGVRVYGPKDIIYGLGEAWVDGESPVQFSQYLDEVDISAASRGYEKRYGLPLFAVSGLKYGPHTLHVRVIGEKAAGDTGVLSQGAYVSIDCVVTETLSAKPPLRLILNRDFNYPRLVRGNYMRKPVVFAIGDRITAAIRLFSKEVVK